MISLEFLEEISPEDLDTFLFNWEIIVKSGWDPELFFGLPRFHEIYQEKKTIFELSEADSKDESVFVEIIKNIELSDNYLHKGEISHQIKLAKKQGESISKLSSISRNFEYNFMNIMKDLYKKDDKEQKWIVLKSIEQFLEGGIKNHEILLEIIKSSFLNEYFIVRFEALNLLKLYILKYPNNFTSIIKSIITDNNEFIKIKWIQLLSTMSFEDAQPFYEQLKAIFSELVELGKDIVKEIHKIGNFWENDQVYNQIISFNNAEINEGKESEESLYLFYRFVRKIQTYCKKPFDKYVMR